MAAVVQRLKQTKNHTAGASVQPVSFEFEVFEGLVSYGLFKSELDAGYAADAINRRIAQVKFWKKTDEAIEMLNGLKLAALVYHEELAEDLKGYFEEQRKAREARWAAEADNASKLES
ncbi:hypothetical protein [Pseudomonas turukhanskensis]|uniref:Uncharacterized protein n=1 Tax=Pseudomonas turukhanskensis TaxID=1806536 RepID=A0A9W6NEZ4_9PSED|nr:hypothetical protein [Pseudomonas turukhanskensis]GLK88302.1 hypothetical protein GCM10017655_13640 [Pseudomonas turukhanskensis]